MLHVSNESESPVDNCRFLSKLQQKTMALIKKKHTHFPSRSFGVAKGDFLRSRWTMQWVRVRV